MTSLLIRNARVLALDDADHEWPRADVVIEGGDIAAIGPDAGAAWPRRLDRVIEAEGLLAMPGLINAHFHSPGNLMKGALPGLPLELFMLHEVPPLAPAGDGERLVYVRTMLGAVEMLRRGITAVHDDAYHVPVATRESISGRSASCSKPSRSWRAKSSSWPRARSIQALTRCAPWTTLSRDSAPKRLLIYFSKLPSRRECSASRVTRNR
jgi:predicted amidohydrolase YtcJ